MHAAKSAESHITLRRIERLADNRLATDRGLWSQARPGETLLVEETDGWITVAELEVGADERPELACRGAVRSLRGLVVRPLGAS